MTLINIADAQRPELLKLPESGMGFQLVEAKVQGVWHRLLVFNASTALDLTALNLQESDNPAVIAANEEQIMEALSHTEMMLFMSPAPHSFRLPIARVGTTAQPIVRTRIATTPSTLIKHVVLTTDRVFHRFSAFNPDRRVAPVTGDFLPGTYAVPESELLFIPTGFAAVGRCALPNTVPASNHYVVCAPANTHVSFGTVAPAFGQAGGGVEAFFPNGVVNKPPHTPVSQIPDE